MAQDAGSEDTLLTLTADIVAAHVSNNSVAVNDLPNLIQNVHQALTGISGSKPDTIACLECGQKQKMLKRHLSTAHSMTPTEYRQKYSLAPNYPMVAPNYAEQRRTLAKSIGLGTKRRRSRSAKK
jgi:predicted transcriptional regulator